MSLTSTKTLDEGIIHLRTTASQGSQEGNITKTETVGEVESAMTYQDNWVKMTWVPEPFGYGFVSAKFIVDQLSISPGQDPQEKNKVGDTKEWEGESGKIMWSVGRHGTDTVAKWWSARIKVKESTFGHDPKELNFAFIGHMELLIKGGAFPSPVYFTIAEVAIGQGHAGSSNNWWFGCVGSNPESPDFMQRIKCPGYSETGQRMFFTFSRGSPYNDPDEIQLVAISTLP